MFFPPQFVVLFFVLFVILGAYFVVSLALAIIWTHFAIKRETASIGNEAADLLRQTQSLSMPDDDLRTGDTSGDDDDVDARSVRTASSVDRASG